MEIQFTTRIFKEGRNYVAYALELEVSSCGGTKEKALKNLKEAVRLFLEEAEWNSFAKSGNVRKIQYNRYMIVYSGPTDDAHELIQFFRREANKLRLLRKLVV